jgi:hypothetical protein
MDAIQAFGRRVLGALGSLLPREMKQQWTATIGQDGNIHIPAEHIFELAAIVHGYSLNTAMIDAMMSKPIIEHAST